jgi:hypothetical protein
MTVDLPPSDVSKHNNALMGEHKQETFRGKSMQHNKLCGAGD